MQFSHPVTLALGIAVTVGSIAAMTNIVRRSALVPFLAVITGAVGIVFFLFSTFRFVTLPGVIVSTLAIAFGAISAVRRRPTTAKRETPVRGLFIRSDSGVWHLRSEEYLSDSGHWRTRMS